MFNSLDNKLRPKLSAWIRSQNEQQKEIPEINLYNINNLQTGLPDYNPREKQIILLQNIERKTEYPGKKVRIVPEYDIPLAWASTKEEFIYYINSLIERGFLRGNEKNVYPLEGITESGRLLFGSMAFYVEITADGWDYLEQHERHIEERTQAFVAMSFSTNLKHIYEGPISNAIIKAGYKPHRVDAEPHIDRIDAKIIAEIKNSRFIVADVTQHKRGVYFEAGYALGLGLPVIWCVRKDHLKKVHFDTRQFNHIDWKSESDLETRLFDSICANIGKRKESP
ncbi:MAG: hypothetical protein AB1424_14550 [Thermodesulfobacteriota bacterium]